MRKRNYYDIGSLGLGQMGGSFGLALKAGQSVRTLCGYDIDKSLLKAALNDNVIDMKCGTAFDLIERSQIVVLALPIDEIIRVLKRYRMELSAKSLVTDFGSVRRPIQLVSARLRLNNHIGIHPICGTALRGRSGWNGNLFEDSDCFMFFRESSDLRAIKQAEYLIKSIYAMPRRLDYRIHDLSFAITSGLPHVLGYSLAKLRKDSKNIPVEMEGPSFRSATRIAGSDPNMVARMLYHNRANIITAISRHEGKIEKLKKVLVDGDLKRLTKMLKNYGYAS